MRLRTSLDGCTETAVERPVARLMAIILAMMMLAVACGGGSADSTDESVAAGNGGDASEPSETIKGGGNTAAGPIDGLITSQPSFGSALWAIDPTGSAIELQIDGVDNVDVQHQPVLVGDVAFILGATERDGQSFSNDISVVRVDLVTGAAHSIAQLGFDQETDDSTADRISHELVAATADQVVVKITEGFSADPAMHVYDATSGAEQGSFTLANYEWSGDSGSCSGGIGEIVGLSDGRFVGSAVDSPAFLDVTSGAIEPVITCDQDEPNLADFVALADFDTYASVRPGDAATDEDRGRILDLDLTPEGAFVEGDGALWWVNSDTRFVGDDVVGLAGAVVRFDLAAGAVSDIYPLGDLVGNYDGCPIDAEVCDTNLLVRPDLAWIDGQLVIVPEQESAAVVVLDPATSSVVSIPLPLGEGIDYTNADLLPASTQGVWIEVSRMTITKDDDSGRTASGLSYFELLDPTTGTITMSFKAEDVLS